MFCDSKSKKEQNNNSHLIIAIHVPILSIFIVVFISFFINQKNILRNIENDVLEEAAEINKISFMRSVYYPNEGFGGRADNVNKSLKIERERLQILTKRENNVSQLSIPSTSADIKELFRYLNFLINPISISSTDDLNHSIGNNKFIPQDPSNRGEEILRVLNILGHSYLFPETPFDTDGIFKKGPYNKIYFGKINEVRNWLSELNEFVFQSKGFRYDIYHFKPVISYLKSLEERDKELIEKWENSRLLISFGNINPDKLFNDFISNLKAVENVANSTQEQIVRFDKQKSYFPSKTKLTVLFFILGFSFLFGVISSLLSNKLPKYFYIHLPVIFYICAFIYMFIIYL